MVKPEVAPAIKLHAWDGQKGASLRISSSSFFASLSCFENDDVVVTTHPTNRPPGFLLLTLQLCVDLSNAHLALSLCDLDPCTFMMTDAHSFLMRAILSVSLASARPFASSAFASAKHNSASTWFLHLLLLHVCILKPLLCLRTHQLGFDLIERLLSLEELRLGVVCGKPLLHCGIVFFEPANNRELRVRYRRTKGFLNSCRLCFRGRGQDLGDRVRGRRFGDRSVGGRSFGGRSAGGQRGRGCSAGRDKTTGDAQRHVDERACS